MMLRQLHFSRLDLELHSRFDPAGEESLYECDQRMASDVAPLPPLPEDRFLCSFQHIFAGATFRLVRLIAEQPSRCHASVHGFVERAVSLAAQD